MLRRFLVPVLALALLTPLFASGCKDDKDKDPKAVGPLDTKMGPAGAGGPAKGAPKGGAANASNQ